MLYKIPNFTFWNIIIITSVKIYKTKCIMLWYHLVFWNFNVWLAAFKIYHLLSVQSSPRGGFSAVK